MKSVFALAALAAIGLTGTAFAGDATSTDSWATTSVPPAATAPTAMSDSDMDKVTAGAPGEKALNNKGQALGLAPDRVFPGKGQGPNHNNDIHGRWQAL